MNNPQDILDARAEAGGESGAASGLSFLGKLLAGGLMLCIRLYRWTLSPAKAFLCGPLSGCRFEPSCSEYAAEAVRRHGAFSGSRLALKRICRCHPWGGCGHDPVPARD